MKRNIKTKRSNYWLRLLFVATLGVTIIGILCWKGFKILREQKEKRIRTAIAEMTVIRTEKSQVLDNWWIKTPPPPTMETKKLLDKKKDELLSTLQTHRHISAETEKIAARFNEFRLAVFIGGQARYLLENNMTPPLGTNGIDIGFFSEEDARRNLIYFVTWRPERNIITIPAISYPEKLRAALLFHELGHALRHNKNDHGNQATINTEEKVNTEEIEMHQLGADILNKLCGGAYYGLIDEILSRHPQEKKFERIAASLTTQDRDAFDAMCGCRDTEAPRKMLASNYTLLIGFRHAERNGLGEDGKVAVYQKLRNITR